MGILGTSGVVNYSNTTSGKAEDVHALNGIGGVGVRTIYAAPGPTPGVFNWRAGVNFSSAFLYSYGQFNVDLAGYPNSITPLLQIPGGTVITLNGQSYTLANPMYYLFGTTYTGYLYGASSDSSYSSMAWTQTPAPEVAPVLTQTPAPPYLGTSGGDSLNIYGENFANATQVEIDGVPTTFNVFSNSYLYVPSAPAHAEGQVSVTVTNPWGTSNSETLLYVGAPTVTSISPSEGSEFGGTFVTITGTNFGDPVSGDTFVNSVSIGGTYVAIQNVYFDTITGITYEHPQEAGVSVDVVTQFGTNTPNTLFTYGPPSGEVRFIAGNDYFISDLSLGLSQCGIGYSTVGGNAIYINPSRWFNQDKVNFLLAQQPGEVFTSFYSLPGGTPLVGANLLTITETFYEYNPGLYKAACTSDTSTVADPFLNISDMIFTV